MTGVQVVAGLLAAATCSAVAGAASGAEREAPIVESRSESGDFFRQPVFPYQAGNSAFFYYTVPWQARFNRDAGTPPILPLFYQKTAPGGAGSYHNPAARFAQTASETEAVGTEKDVLQEIVVTGTAAIGSGDRETARKAAIQQALRNALEKVVGLYVSSATVAEKFITLTDRVYTHSEGFVVPGEILEETVDQGTLTVRMRATVSMRPLLNRLKELGLTRAWKVVVFIHEGEGTTAPGAAPLAKAEIEQRLLGAGFQIIYQAGEPSGDTALYLQALRNENGAPLADLLIIGEASARLVARLPVTIGNQIITTNALYAGRVDARAIRVETGEVVASHVVDEASADRMDSIAAGSAVQASARRIAASFLDDIMQLPAGYLRRVKLEVSGFQKRARAQAFEEALPLLPGIRNARRQEYTNGCLVMELEVDSETADHLGADLENAAGLRSFGLTVESDTKARIRARVSDTAPPKK